MPDNGREQWKTRWGFLFAAIGSAIGLGNIWRFSYMAYDNGGGAFLIPYFIALVTAGIPLLILEYALGHKMVSSPPLAFKKAKEGWSWLGWWAIAIGMFGIVIYYAVVVSWCVNYVVLSFDLGWGSNPNGFFFNEFLNKQGPAAFGAPTIYVVLGLFLVWFLNWFITYKGIQGGIEKACKIFIPALAVFLGVLIIRGLFLPGAEIGLKWYLKPNFDRLLDPEVWRGAYSQIFYSLSVAFGIMIAYASYLPKKSNLKSNAFITGLFNTGFAIIAGFAVFSTLGFMSQQKPLNEMYPQKMGSKEIVQELKDDHYIDDPSVFYAQSSQGIQQGNKYLSKEKIFDKLPQVLSKEEYNRLKISKVVTDGIGLAFIAYPEAISYIPALPQLVGIIFFLALVIAGLSSSISLVEAFASSIIDVFHVSRKRVITYIAIVGFLGGLLFTFPWGLSWLDMVDHYLLQIGLVVIGLIECIFLGWIYGVDKLEKHIFEAAGVKIGKWWAFCIKYLVPAVLFTILALGVVREFTSAYGGYPVWALVLIGFGWLVATFVIAMILYKFGKKFMAEYIYE